MVRFEKPTWGHAHFIAETMRDEDEAEVLAMGKTPLDAMKDGMLNSSFMVSVVAADGTPLTMLGVTELSKLTGSGVPWLLSSKYALEHKKAFLMLSPPVIKEMSILYPRLVNYVHSKNRLSIRWLKWLGFVIHIDKPVIIPSTGETFYKFTMETENV